GARRSPERAQRNARRPLSEEAGFLRLHAAEDLRPRSAPAVLRRTAASAAAAGFVLHPAAPRPDQRAGCALDRREPTDARCRARRYDLALPRARSARGRLRTEARDRFHRLVDRQDHARVVWSVAAEMDRAMRRLRILVLMHPDFVPPDSTRGYTPQEINEWKTEYDVVSPLRPAGHEVRPARRTGRDQAGSRG